MTTSEEKMKQNLCLGDAEIESRNEAFGKHLESVQNPLKEIVQELKDYGDWKVISFNGIQKKYNIKPIERSVFLQELQRHDNIITRPSKEKRRNGEVTSTTPLEYKYVEKQDKIEIGINGVFYRKIKEEDKPRLIELLSQNKLKGNLADFLAVLNYLYTEEADMGWIRPKILKMLADIGISFNDASDIIDEMEQMKLLVRCSTVNNKGKNVPFYTLTLTEDVFSMRLEEAKNPETIKIHRAEKKKRNRRHGDYVDEDKIEERLITEDDEDNISDLLEKISARIREEELTWKEQKNRQAEIIDRLLKENEGLRSRSDALEKINRKKKMEIESLVRFNNAFIANAQNEMMIMSGRFMTLMEEFSNLQHYQFKHTDTVNAYRGRAMEIVGDTSKKITEFKLDRIPPDLK
nr:MAG TPA: hypothetical protein [Caudoviricetes sp.]